MSSTIARTSSDINRVRLGSRQRVLIIDSRRELRDAVCKQLAGDHFQAETLDDSDTVAGQISSAAPDTVVFSPLVKEQHGDDVTAKYTRRVIELCRQHGVSRIVLLSSAEVYGAHYCNPGLISEKSQPALKKPNAIAQRWAEIEAIANETYSGDDRSLITLRPCYTPTRGGSDCYSKLFGRRLSLTLAGFDPSIQLLSVEDLAAAISAAVQSEREGVYNVAPDTVIPLRKALRRARTWRIPMPYSLHRAVRSAFKRVATTNPDQLDYMRYSWTVSNQKIKSELGYEPGHHSCQVVDRLSNQQHALGTDTSHDDFGMDEDYVRSAGNWQIGFMEKLYWRVEVEGLDIIPQAGGAILTGIHRGFMPFDGVMMVHLMRKQIRRVPRFLMHPALAKHPHLCGFLTRYGGVMACQANAEHVLSKGEMVGVFPEGIRGAFRLYERGRTYELGKFRDDFVSIAIRNRVPIIPFVNVGPAESFPILKKIEWQWWKQQTHWPCFPITPTWPLLPVPLPSKWHFKILEPIETTGYSAADATNRKVVRELSRETRERMQAAINDMLARRKSVFFGSIFKQPRTEDGTAAMRSGVDRESRPRMAAAMTRKSEES